MSDVMVVAISDFHGTLPEHLPASDLLLIAGDISPLQNHDPYYQAEWLRDEFGPWLRRQPAKHIVATWGNHDFIGERLPHLVPPLPWTLLVDEAVELLGLKIYGTPWQPRFMDWAFNLDEPELEKKWARIPAGIDILVCHGPPHGFGDLASAMASIRNEPEHTGSPSLTRRILEIRPQLVVFGHIHEGYGVYEKDGIVMANVSIGTGRHRMTNEPYVGVVQSNEPPAF
jgi:Icc-related predicted phosphoesterase